MPGFRSKLRACAGGALALAAVLLGAAPSTRADAPSVEVAVELPLTGDEVGYGPSVLDGIRLAIDEANAAGAGPRIELKTYDDKGDDDTAKAVAGRIVASRAVLTLGPAISTNALAAGPIYAAAGLVSLAAPATADSITRNATTFRVVFKNGDQGAMLAFYLAHALGRHDAAVIVSDNGYGHTLEDGFRRAAADAGVGARYFLYRTQPEAERIARQLAEDATHPAVVFLTLDADAARMLVILRRAGARGPFLGGDALGDEVLSRDLADQPEEKRQPGYFTEGVYGVSPMILDSADADILAFAGRFRARFGHDPMWMSVAGYDAGHLAAQALRAVTARAGADAHALRAGVLAYLQALNNPAQALPGLLGPMWFDAERGRPQAIRVGQFHHGHIVSAPLQIVEVNDPDPEELAAGSVFAIGAGNYARLQRVVYTGMFIDNVQRIDLGQSSFGANVYLWLRYARDAGPGAPDPTDLIFPDMLSGSFDAAHPAKQREMADGTVYRLWNVHGTFRNDFDLHRFPFDRQYLTLSLFNARAAADRIVYALDQHAPAAASDPAAMAEEDAFANLTQWWPLGVSEQREDLVTDSALGDPDAVGLDSRRELSGFQMTIEVERRAISTLAKTLLPLVLMTVILFASLYFPAVLVKEKITVAVTGVVSGAVLLTAINSQLGGVGYTVAVEYAFYVFFALATLCIISVLAVERLRTAGSTARAASTERWTRAVFLLSVAAVVAGAIALFAAGRAG